MTPLLKINDTIEEIVMKMAEGVPGAIAITMAIIEQMATGNSKVVLQLATLDEYDIRGSRLWVLFADHCDANIETLIATVKDTDKLKKIIKEHGWDNLNQGGSNEEARTAEIDR